MIFEELKTTEDVERMKAEVEKQLEQEYKQGVSKPGKGLKELLKKLDEINKVRITVAVELPNEVIERMSRLVKTRLGPEVIMDIEEDRRLIGGATVEWEGKYYDGSISKRLEAYFEKIDLSALISNF